MGVVAMAVAEATRKALRSAPSELLQPMMQLEVHSEAQDVGPITTDIG